MSSTDLQRDTVGLSPGVRPGTSEIPVASNDIQRYSMLFTTEWIIHDRHVGMPDKKV